ncbi:DNA polymerase alpha subunit B [Venustampulla echinocandica]|uniref:DNA polymerase alpha subunit B n=1 Tax=Venustampulla echinocandica TaxID=2656787 RepID=A0A370TV48_9HELO|nr:DNA polymerase alpha subunit B [Venustampulla echinocandica]RDL39417.1 DNA polymerase alpha subunit B [Venustampulla echinocandica]
MADVDTQELQMRFSSAAGRSLEADVLSEMQSIMRLHSIDVEELWYKWESYSMKMGSDDMKLNIETARNLKQDIQDGLERENRSKAHVQTNKRGGATPRNVISNGDVFGILDGVVPNTPRVRATNRANGSTSKRRLETPSISRVKAEPASSPPDFKTPFKPGEQNGATIVFNDRPNAGQAVEVLNDHLQVSEPPIAPYSEPRLKVVANSDFKKLAYKPMAMKSSEASEVLDDRIDEFMALVQGHHSLEDSAFGSAASQNTNEIVAVGRIACDSSEGKLNVSSLVLETSRRMGAGRRIPLKVHSLPGFQFFPGQIVALKGINASGEYFTVTEVLEMPLLGGAASATARLREHTQRLRGDLNAMESDTDPSPLNILVAAGPYTADDNLDFEPFHALCSQAADSYADALVLVGPFIDIDHPLIATGDFDLPDEALAEPDTITMTTVFKYLISSALVTLVSSNPNITILLVPSVKDVISKHVSWPQEPTPRKELGLPKSVKIIGNPMTLSLNEIAIGISSQDILTELRQSEVVGGRLKESSLLARLPKYLIEQRNFFPLFPPVDRGSLPKTGAGDSRPVGAMLDTSYLKLGEMVNVRPDVLIVPSALPPFAKVVESVVAINPGYLSKRRGAGTYAKLTVYPPSLTDEERDSPQMVGHRLFERARVDILRI